jgi:phytoene dehydrogenase-like protein
MMSKSIVIIGGGLAGLSAGCYGQMNGYQTGIFEMADKAGGVCTAWQRGGYTIDGAMNWIEGTVPDARFYHFWQELGAAQAWKIYHYERNMINEDRDGKAAAFYCDADRFERYLLELAPADRAAIQEFTQAIRASSSWAMPVDKPVELWDDADRTKMAQSESARSLMQKWSAVTFTDFAQRLKNPDLQAAFAHFGPFPMAKYIELLGLLHSKSAGYVIGGALALVRPIEKRYLDLGGKIHFNARVAKILVENDKAVGIRLADGTEYRADYVISAGDGRTAIFEMLGGKYINETIKNMYERPPLAAPIVYIALGVNRAFDDVPPTTNGLNYPLAQPIVIAGKPRGSINVRIYNFDPTLAPPGKNLVVVQYPTMDYHYWQTLSQDNARYRVEKERIAADVVAGLEQRFPGISEQVEMRDVATPLTWERHTGNWQGAYAGWMSGPVGNIGKTLPGLENFYMAGQWVNPGGGMPSAVMSGNHTIQFICRKDNKKFLTAKPD